jgi:CheY-like chemotaxis protein
MVDSLRLTTHGGQRYRVLLVEDNAILSELTAEILQDLNCEVSIVNNGKSAIEAATENDWDIILMDIIMPGMNGIEATRIIKKQTGLQQLPIVGLTGADDVLSHCLDAGMVEVLIKPIGEVELEQCLKRWRKHQ